MTGAASSNRDGLTGACKRPNTFQAPWPPPAGDGLKLLPSDVGVLMVVVETCAAAAAPA